MKQIISIILLLFLGLQSNAQIVQTVRGSVLDSESQFPLVGAKVVILTSDTTLTLRAKVDENGNFVIEKVPIGKHRLTASQNSYESQTVPVVVNSGKESIVNLLLSESVL